MTTVIRPLHTTAASSSLRIGALRRWTLQRGLVGVALAALLTVAVAVPAAPAHAAGTITVTTTADEYGAGAACSLREAVRTANDGANFGGCGLAGTQPFTINLPAGVFQLTIAGANNVNNATGDLDILVSGTALVGAGAASTIIPVSYTHLALRDAQLLYCARGNISLTKLGGCLLYTSSGWSSVRRGYLARAARARRF